MLFLNILRLKDSKKALKALRKIAREQKIDVLTKLISDYWGSEGDDDNSSAAESNVLV